jgi:hypothetical protein
MLTACFGEYLGTKAAPFKLCHDIWCGEYRSEVNEGYINVCTCNNPPPLSATSLLGTIRQLHMHSALAPAHIYHSRTLLPAVLARQLTYTDWLDPPHSPPPAPRATNTQRSTTHLL